MKTEQQDKYAEWLLAVANTRLMYNTVDELENFLGNHAIQSNGIRRVYNTFPKIRSTLRDLKVEASVWTDGALSLDELLVDYERATKFYMNHLCRRTDLHLLAKQLLAYSYIPYNQEGLPKRILTLFKRVKDEGIEVPLLILLMLDVIPGYASKNGDVQDIEIQWRKAMDFLDDFTKGCGGVFESLPALARAREEQNKCRLMLIYHTTSLLGVYESFADANDRYATSSEMKRSRVDLALAGYWNECGGRADETSFWKIEDTIDDGVFFATWWHKDSNKRLLGVRYTMILLESDEGGLIVYLMHPEALKHRVKGKKYGDSDHVWYFTDMPAEDTRTKLPLIRLLPSKHWKDKLSLTRVEDSEIISTYDKWLKQCEIVRPHGDSEYDFFYKLWGITQEAVYIYDDIDGMYFKVPRDSPYEFDKIGMDDNVGILTMGGKRYLAFDDLMLYIPIKNAALRKYGITKVSVID